MLGARREFLDPTEMALFNADILKVLAVCGALRLLHEEVDKVVAALAGGKRPALPRMVADGPAVVARAGFSNPYAAAKALAAHRTAEAAGALAHDACFRMERPEEYLPACAAVHEMVRAAARLADEAREAEKGADRVLRTPHGKDGSGLRKSKLMEKPG
jgi:methylenetetrahydromethanopterin dehydrogenase